MSGTNLFERGKGEFATEPVMPFIGLMRSQHIRCELPRRMPVFRHLPINRQARVLRKVGFQPFGDGPWFALRKAHRRF